MTKRFWFFVEISIVTLFSPAQREQQQNAVIVNNTLGVNNIKNVSNDVSMNNAIDPCCEHIYSFPLRKKQQT